MSNTNGASQKFYRVAADALGTALGVLVLYLGVHQGSADESAIGLSLLGLGASQLHTDLTQ